MTAVTEILAEKAKNEIRMPQGLASINDTLQNFATIKYFPRVIDVIDGTHIPIKAPSVNEHIYVNRKHFYSLNVQVICDSKQLILNYCCKYPGSTHGAQGAHMMPREHTWCSGSTHGAQGAHMMPREHTWCSGSTHGAQGAHMVPREHTWCPGSTHDAQGAHMMPREHT